MYSKGSQMENTNIQMNDVMPTNGQSPQYYQPNQQQQGPIYYPGQAPNQP